MNATAGVKAYATVGVESGVAAADPHKLIAMLYQGALLAIANAKNALLRKDIAAKGAAISKAITIIDEGLNASLDKNAGGDLANNLASLYDYMGRRLLSANLNNDMEAMDEVARLLSDLKSAWESIRPSNSSSAAATGAAMQPAATVKPLATKPAIPAVSPPAPAAAPMRPATAAPAATPQQRVANKVQMAYGRM